VGENIRAESESMNLIRLLNCIGYVFVLTAYLATAWLTSSIARSYQIIFTYQYLGLPLPDLTKYVLIYGLSGISIVANTILGVAFAVLLIRIELTSEKWRKLLPFCVSIALCLVILQLSVLLVGVSLPQVNPPFSTINARHY
jgi:hypothetical protein